MLMSESLDYGYKKQLTYFYKSYFQFQNPLKKNQQPAGNLSHDYFLGKSHKIYKKYHQ